MIISISGKIGSGKDTVAKMLQYLNVRDADPKRTFFNHGESVKTLPPEDIVKWEFTDSQFEVKRFADKIKDTICLWLGCTREQLEDREFKEKPLGEEWWYYRYWLHEKVISEGIEKLRPIQDHKTHRQSWQFIDKDIVDKMSQEEKNYHAVELVKLTPRKLMQLLGTEAGREIIHPDIWVNARFADYRKSETTRSEFGTKWEGKYPDWIIPDTRFPNEINRVDKHNGLKIRVERDFRKRIPQLFMEYGYDGSDDSNIEQMFYSYLQREHPDQYEKVTHPSETSLDDYDDWHHLINNNGSLHDLFEEVKIIHNKIKS